MPAMNGVAVTFFVEGVLMLFFLVSRTRRAEFRAELHNIRWSFLVESITFISFFTLFFAMSGLPATIVSSIAAIQPLAVLLFERAMHKRFGSMAKDDALLPKLVPIALIVIGVALMYLAELA
jgi:cytochrome c biogenesis protein CcdA